MGQWQPRPGSLAIYVGRTANKSRIVKVVAEASGGRMCVEAIGKKSAKVQLTVKRENLKEPEPGLF